MAKKWDDLNPTQQKIAVAAGVAELALSSYCAVDLRKRPKTQIRGPKWLWVPLLGVQPIGPIAYLIFGRKKS
ncbi:PLD nuclease N-terminal domain-containing protein [Nocardioides sp.]|uniref:PLD nuclease N-terminal domain-containing protein n=1 Tax=Nocardioides sp. TaxID=35761 RepID=UPI002615B3C4|nr:PLD nuclease N-terminal domain-containing protein [Nocardioides sp.]